MYKLIALDMDGTLLCPDKTLSARTVQRIGEAKAQGYQVVLASGRPLGGMLPYLEALDLCHRQQYVLAFNGALLMELGSKAVVHSAALTVADAIQWAELADTLGVNIHAFSEEHGLVAPRLSQYTQHEMDLNRIGVKIMPFSTLSPADRILKIMLIDPVEILEPAVQQIPAALSKDYYIARSAPFFLEIMNPAANKGEGIAALARHLGMGLAHVIGVGDAENDHTLLQRAGLGVAMGNGTPETLALADHVTASNADDGVALVIEQFLLAQSTA